MFVFVSRHLDEFILPACSIGYRLPFQAYPPYCDLQNNRSALKHPEFANLELLNNDDVSPVGKTARLFALILCQLRKEKSLI